MVPFSGMLPAPKALLIVGGATTVTVAFEVLPVPPSVEVTWTLLFLSPAVVPFTFREIEQVALGPKLPPVKLAVLEPAVAVNVPPQLVLMLGGVATTSPAGRLSVKATPVNPMVLLGF